MTYKDLELALAATESKAHAKKKKILENVGAEHCSCKMAQHLTAVPLCYWKEKGLERDKLEEDFI